MNYKHNADFCKAFGEHLRSLRETKGISMRQFAVDVDVDYSQIARIERGETNPTISTVQAIAEALDLPVKALFDFTFPQKKK